MKIRKGDNIIVLSGKDRGKSGKVLQVFPKKNLALVEGVNIVKKHQRPRKANQVGQIVERTMPINASNIAPKDPKSGGPTRVGYKIEDGNKVRIARKSGAKLS